MLLQIIFGNSPEKICLVIFIPMLKPNALGIAIHVNHQLRRSAFPFFHSHSDATVVFRKCFYGICRTGHFLFTKHTAENIGSLLSVVLLAF